MTFSPERDFEIEAPSGYGGFNPDFVKQVWAKRREQEQSRLRRAAGELTPLPATITFDERTPAREIIRATAARFGVSTDAILSRSRSRGIVAARFEAIKCVAEARPDLAVPVIARIFKRDHTTILNALRKTGVERPPLHARKASAE